MSIFSDTICALGEGPLWHPTRGQFFWFDILGCKLLTRTEAGEKAWSFDEHVSAAGWVDDDTLIMASETALWRFSLIDGARSKLVELEADMPAKRSNDGRADPQGGFWIGTMGKDAEPHAGSIYRYYRGELRKLFDRITVSNSICFSPDGTTAYFADTFNRRIDMVRLDAQGWPQGDVTTFVDLKEDGLNPDGSVVDAAGNLWNAQWGAAQITCYDPTGAFKDQIGFPATQISCPCFGGDDLQTLYATSAAVGMTGAQDGMTFAVHTSVKGQAEH
ncbi:MAG: SMP-30/gluconolactonase/LRE family protein, partial [Rhodobacteraceae bacterium]|nr:SMP-30/gluconolactonase/LRE family protein [Paracoccaceae bacterium]